MHMKNNLKKIFSRLSIYSSSLFIILSFCGLVSIPLLLFSFIFIGTYIGIKNKLKESKLEENLKEKTTSEVVSNYKKDYHHYNHPKNLNKNKVLVRKRVKR